MAHVRLDGVRKSYGTGPTAQVAVHGLDLTINDGEFVVCVGPSGCGKSTLLRMIAGLETITAGTLEIGGVRMNEVAPGDRDIAMVFQSYALYPHMTVYDNLAFALRLRKLRAAELDTRVRDAARAMHIESLLDRYPKALSGGERQRVALGRALVRQPRVFLFDEPLSNLDATLRVQMRREIARLHRTLGTTMIYVTHDQVEAMTLGDRIVVLRDGRMEQVDTPAALYATPQTTFVAAFIGNPAMNLLTGTVTADAGRLWVRQGGWLNVPVPAPWHNAVTGRVGQPVVVGIRPEHLSLVADGVATETAAHVHTQVEFVEQLGNETVCHMHAHFGTDGGTRVTEAGAGDIIMRSSALTIADGAVVRLHADDAHLHLFDPGSGRRLAM